MGKIKIGVDLDSTLNNLETVWLEKYNSEYNDNLTFFSEWNVENIVKPECGNNMFKYLREPGFFEKLGIKDDAKKVMKSLNSKCELYIITAYFAESCGDKKNWVKKNLPFFNEKNIIFCNNKSLLNVDFLIDDGPHNFENFNGFGLIFDMPYNKHLIETNNRIRVQNWSEIEKFFATFENNQ